MVANNPSENTEHLANAVCRAATQFENVNTRLLFPLAAGVQDVLTANAVIIGTTENFGYMSGLIKDFFERIYYPCLEKTQALPWALYVRAGKDGAGALRAVCAIAVGLKWRAVQEPLLLHGNHKPEFIGQCETLGSTMAAGLEAGLF